MLNQEPILPAIQPDRPTLSSVLRGKFLAWVEKSTAKTLLFSILEAFLIFAVVGILISPERTGHVILWVTTAGHFFMLKVSTGWIIVRSRKRIFSRILKFRRRGAQLIEGIPLEELLHFLISSGGFKFDTAIKKFRIHRKIYDRITRRLSDLEILQKSGKNNAWILNADLSRQEIADRIHSGSTLKISRAGETEVKSKEEIHEELENFDLSQLKSPDME